MSSFAVASNGVCVPRASAAEYSAGLSAPRSSSSDSAAKSLNGVLAVNGCWVAHRLRETVANISTASAGRPMDARQFADLGHQSERHADRTLLMSCSTIVSARGWSPWTNRVRLSSMSAA